MVGRIIKIDDYAKKDNEKFGYWWLYFKMKDGMNTKTWIYENNKRYKSVWKYVISIGVGIEVSGLKYFNRELLNPNSDVRIVAWDERIVK